MSDQWQPIDTAPRDGRDIDVWVRHTSSGTEERIVDVCWYNGGWYSYERDFFEVSFEVTHWMPIPAGPGASDV